MFDVVVFESTDCMLNMFLSLVFVLWLIRSPDLFGLFIAGCVL